MASSPLYSRDEIAQLEALAAERDWQSKVSGPLALRSHDSLRGKMVQVRRAAGIKVKRGPAPGRDNDHWQDDARAASERLYYATLRVGRWS